MIKYLLFILMLMPCISHAYDLTSKDGVKACKNDPACFVCADAATGTIGECTMRPTYDIAINGINNSILNNLCPLNAGKRQCVVKETELSVKETKTGAAVRDFYNVTVTNHGNSLSFAESRCFLYSYEFGDGGSSTGWKCEPLFSNIPFMPLFEMQPNQKITKSAVKLINSGVTHTVNLNQAVTIDQPCFYISAGAYGEHSYQSCRSPQCTSRNVCTGEGDAGQNCTLEWTCDNAYSISFEAELETITKKYDQACPENPATPCLQDNGVYYCNTKDCLPGKDIVISDSDMKDDDMAGDSPSGQKTCSLTEPSLFSGQQLSCRLQSTTNLLARSCCDGKDYNEKLRDALRYGLYYNMFGFKTGKVIDKLFELIGENNFILQYFTDAVEWLTGGPCLQAEITANTLKTTMPYNDGNCVKIGTMCSNYVGSCITIGGTEIWSGGCERPAEVYCCYNDLFQKAIGNAAREQLKIGWGTAEGMSINAPISYGTNPCNPDKKKYKIDCRGISIEELIKLNLNHPSFTNGMQDYVNNMMSQIIGPGGMATGKLQQYLDDSKNIAEDIKDFYK